MDRKEAPDSGIIKPLEEQPERRKGIETAIAGVSAAAAIAIAREAQAATPFDGEVNNIHPDPLQRQTSGAQFVAGPDTSRFDMFFSGTNLGRGTDFFRASYRAEIGPDGNVIYRRLGPRDLQEDISGTSPASAEYTAVEYRRPDGRRDVIQQPGVIEGTGEANAVLDMNGRDVWPSECGGVDSFIHPSARSPRTLKVAVNFGEAFGTVDEDIYRVSIDAPVNPATGQNFCTNIRDRIEAANAVPGGDVCTSVPPVLQCNAESSWGRDLRAPETPEFAIRASGDRIDMLKFDPVTDEYDIYMERGADGCYFEEVAMRPPFPAEPVPQPEEGLGNPSALLTQPLRIQDGAVTRTIYPYVAEFTTSAGGEGPYSNGRPHLQAMAFEITPGGTICEVPVTMEADEVAVVDDDGDGIPNEDDTCAWVQESGNIDASGPSGAADGIGDACQTACESWPAVNPPAGTGPSDLWVCQSTEIQGYDHQLKRGDGSTLLTSFEVPDGEFEDGDLDLPPGENFYWMHAQAAQFQGEEVPSPSIAFPAGNSAHIEILSTDHPDGTPGDAIFTHLPYPSGEPVATPIGVGTHDFDPGLGDVLGLSGTVVRGSAGEENLPMDCPPVCVPGSDGGTPDAGGSDAGGGDAGADGGADAGPTCPPVCIPQPDAGPDAGPEQPDGGGVDAPPDAGQDANPDDSGSVDPPDAADQSDANNSDPKPDSGPNARFDGGPSRRTDATDTGHDEGSHNGGGCSCTISQQPEHGHNAPLSMDGFSMMTPIIAALLLKRRARLGQFLRAMFTANGEK